MPENSLIGSREEITDLFDPQIYEIKDKETDQYVFKIGKLLKFDYEGSITCIRITKMDRKNRRMWGIHINPMQYHTAMSHYGHNIDSSQEIIEEFGVPWCQDCEVPVNQPSSEDGEARAAERRERTLPDGTEIPKT